MSEQIVLGGTNDPLNATATEFNPVMGDAEKGGATAEANRYNIMPIACTLSNLYIQLENTAGGTATRTFTIRKNTANSSVSVAMTALMLTGSDLTNTAVFSVGDFFTFSQVPATTPAASGYRYAYQLRPTTEGETALFGQSTVSVTSASVTYTPLHGGGNSATEAGMEMVVAANGSINNLFIRLSGGTGAGKAYAFTVRQNGVSTAVTTSLNNVSAGNNTANSIYVQSGDTICLQITPSSSPNSRFVGASVRFIPNVVGQFLFGASVYSPSTSATNYTWVSAGSGLFNATETTRMNLAGAMTTQAIFIKMTTAPGGVASYAFTLRENQVSTGLSVTVSGANTGGSAYSNVTHAWADQLGTECVPSTTPNSEANVLIGYLGYIGTAGSAVIQEQISDFMFCMT